MKNKRKQEDWGYQKKDSDLKNDERNKTKNRWSNYTDMERRALEEMEEEKHKTMTIFLKYGQKIVLLFSIYIGDDEEDEGSMSGIIK